MADVPLTAYARTVDGGTVAYQVSGAGSLDLFFLLAAPIPLDLLWDEPGLMRVRTRFDSFSRNIWVEQRGWGSSDRGVAGAGGPDFDEDLTTVVDAVGSERFSLFATAELGPWAIRYTAKHPDRVSALILFGTFASYRRDDRCPWGPPREAIDRITRWFVETWGTGSSVEACAPSRANDDRFREWVARGERLASTPSHVRDRLRVGFDRDERDQLSAIRVPTLVLHRRDDAVIRVESGRYLGDHIRDAKYVELSGADNWFFVGEADEVVDEIEEFLTGVRTGAEGTVVVSTVLFTDIVDSTRQESALGHRAWSNLASDHDARVRKALARHRGHEIKTMGDGFLATFESAGQAMRCGAEIVADAEHLGLVVRVGIHTGEVEFRDGDVSGLAVTIGKRVCDLAAPGQVLVTETVRGTTIGTKVELDDAGEHTLKGVPGRWQLHSLRI